MSDLGDAVIQQHLKTLKLPATRREYGQLARQARADSWSYEYLRELLDTEVSAREASSTARRLREALQGVSCATERWPTSDANRRGACSSYGPRRSRFAVAECSSSTSHLAATTSRIIRIGGAAGRPRHRGATR